MKARKLFEHARCPKCKSEAPAVFSYSDTIDFRNLELDVEDLERSRCSSCGFEWETPEQIERNHVRIKAAYARERDRLRTRDGLLTGEQIHAIREALKINQREAAILFGGGPNSFNKYESGEVLQSFAMDRLIRIAGVLGDRAVSYLRNVNAPHGLDSGPPVTYVLKLTGGGGRRGRSHAMPKSDLSKDFVQVMATLGSQQTDLSQRDEVLQNAPTQRSGSILDLQGIQV